MVGCILVKAQSTTTNDCSTFRSTTDNPAMQWFPDAKFGIFIHMTLQNVPMSQQEKQTYKNDPAVARQIAARLDLSRYDARQQARMFKEWGAQYVVLTTKHHVGFALFDGPSDFSIMNSTQIGRDIVREYVDAIRAEGMKVGLYFSLPDWTHPDYATIANEKVKPAGRKATRAYALEDDTVRWNRFVDHMHRQVEFLCTNYGKIDLIWFDGDWERSADRWRSRELACMIHRLQPDCIINNRLHHPELGHYATPEQNMPLAPKEGWWELCMTPGDNWDGLDADANIKPVSELIRIVTDVVGMNGNVLMNVAPIDQGAISKPQTQRMREVGRWLSDHAEAIYGAKGDFPTGLFHGPVTRKGKTLYLFAQDGPTHEIVLKGTQGNIRSITDLRTGRELPWRYSGGFKNWKQRGFIYITIPRHLIEKNTNVVKVEFEDEPIVFKTPQGGTYEF